MKARRVKILIVDDDPVIVRLVRANLDTNEYETIIASNGKEALSAVEREQPDLVLLDIMMPVMDGFEVCQRLREWSQVPIIMLTARGEERDKVRCLDMGADDYIPKPFGVNELLARVRAVLRRSQAIKPPAAQKVFKHKNLEMSFAERKVTCSGKELRLTPTEYNLLQELVLNADKVLPHTDLLHKIWGPEYQDEKEYLHVFINRLRTKLKSGAADYIVTIPGVGYQLKRNS